MALSLLSWQLLKCALAGLSSVGLAKVYKKMDRTLLLISFFENPYGVGSIMNLPDYYVWFL